ncbi:class I SAM-dependent methyltransferase [Allorhodopirellula solitaria]|uniref:23S rRNA m(2)G2445 methyltransferase n=1 Tax=Allorhodopirellula solitaria TaxID=2527987 RepID=A0A5C5X2V9_9BACT|nr:class I SAM-dependent methyltransferase [Allorhodopirellula solitaria]TWT56515.1 23S rRNA m(2)G2445 methyltransferase [Allorhodopirellula solitaria]
MIVLWRRGCKIRSLSGSGGRWDSDAGRLEAGGDLTILVPYPAFRFPGFALSRHYQLIDFGNGRKLESLAGRIIDRPSPAAENVSPRDPAAWADVDSRYDLNSRTWNHRTAWPDQLAIEVPDLADPETPALRLPVQPTPFGHIGVFPEQMDNWRWLMRTAPVEELSGSPRSRQRHALNLFAYTGASTMAMAGSGMSVAHVDAAKPNVEAAKRVAVASGLRDAPVRYLVDDAAAFVQREIRRGNRYHTIVLDPPAYGHGPKSKSKSKANANSADKRPAKQAQAWRIARDLPELLKNCFQLVSGRSFRILVTGHSAEMDQADVVDLVERNLSHRRIGRLQPQVEAGRMTLSDQAGRKLDAGFYVRCLLATSH